VLKNDFFVRKWSKNDHIKISKNKNFKKKCEKLFVKNRFFCAKNNPKNDQKKQNFKKNVKNFFYRV